MTKTLKVFPQTTPLRGAITVPGDKSVSHRAIILCSLANGTSHIKRWLPAGDPVSTLQIFRQMGVKIDVVEHSQTHWDLIVEGVGMHGLKPTDEPLDSRNAGTCIRLLAGVMAGQRFASVLDGSEQLRKRPMKRIADPLAQMGANIKTTEGNAPIFIEPAELKPFIYEMPVASAQVKSCVLLAGMYTDGITGVIQPGAARDHTERMLNAMGADVRTENTEKGELITIRQIQELQAIDLTVPADISSAAFPLVAAAIIPHSEITVENCGQNETRTGILDILEAMGAELTVTNPSSIGGESSGDLKISFSEMHGTQVGGSVVVRAIDEFPILAVALSQAAGVSSVRDAADLRVKEVDRISVLAGELRKMGVEMEEVADGFNINGPVRLHGADVDSHDDHRLGMSLAIAALAADSPTTIREANCIADSFPGFVETMNALGARMEWIE
ncbi:MAG: 3-phosphoshikimate 1-carboxyvinyltransferase [Candidatus Promineifilaceae bacterium]|jgi:3-phosphoshikimate 1-carboxyvinyltransferase